VAVLLVKTLKKAGYAVPDDISVVGFDNFSAKNSNITTVEVDLKTMVDVAVETMIKKIDYPAFEICRHFASCKLIIKDTVKKIN
jgi:DNA-binding LacI/PurR family transcriptional regulator